MAQHGYPPEPFTYSRAAMETYFKLEIELLSRDEAPMGPAFTELRTSVPRFLAKWLSVQAMELMGSVDEPTVTRGIRSIVVGPLYLADDEQVQDFNTLVLRCCELFGPDMGDVYLREYESDGASEVVVPETDF